MPRQKRQLRGVTGDEGDGEGDGEREMIVEHEVIETPQRAVVEEAVEEEEEREEEEEQ